jgi:hypothetical protein
VQYVGTNVSNELHARHHAALAQALSNTALGPVVVEFMAEPAIALTHVVEIVGSARAAHARDRLAVVGDAIMQGAALPPAKG